MSGVLQILTITLDVLLLSFLVVYFVKLRSREKELANKESNVEAKYRQIIDSALQRESKILDEAERIVAGAEYITRFSKGTVDKSLEKIVGDIEKETGAAARSAMESYTKALSEITTGSVKDFESVTKGLKKDLEKQLEDFPQTMIDHLEKELEEYKKARLKHAEEAINEITQTVSQEILNKAISAHDHKKLLIQALEKAKKEGIFE